MYLACCEPGQACCAHGAVVEAVSMHTFACCMCMCMCMLHVPCMHMCMHMCMCMCMHMYMCMCSRTRKHAHNAQRGTAVDRKVSGDKRQRAKDRLPLRML